MGLGDGIREVLADVGVQTEDINSSAVTMTKLNNDAGKWFTGIFSGLGTTVAFTIACTAAVTIVECIIEITAAHSTSGLFAVQNTAKTSILIAAEPTSTTRTISSHNTTAVASTGAVIELADGESVEGTCNPLSSTIAGKYYLHYIETPI
jgi:hypothetical protein